MATANEQSYAEAINMLNSFNQAMNEWCENVKTATKLCQDNMAGDNYAAKAAANSTILVNKILFNLTTVDKVADALQKQMEEFKDIGNRVRFND